MKKRAAPKKIDTIEKLAVLMQEGFEQVEHRFEQVDKRLDHIDRRLDAIQVRLDRVEARLNAVETRLDEIEERLGGIEHELSDIRRDIERLQEQGASSAGFSKEIDHLLHRVAAIEKHVGIKPKTAA